MPGEPEKPGVSAEGIGDSEPSEPFLIRARFRYFLPKPSGHPHLPHRAMSKPIFSPEGTSGTPSSLTSDPLSAARAWSDPRIDATERRAFMEDIAAPDNMRRAFWLVVFYLPVSVVGVIFNRISVQDDSIGFWSYLDIACALSFFFLILHIRRNPAAIQWKRHLVIAFYLYNIGVMLGYYFAALPRFGGTPYYALGLFLMAVLIRLPGRQFIPILLCTHAVYCAGLLGATSGDTLLANIFGGTNALILAMLASWFLFHRDWETYEKGRVITLRNRELAAANARLNEMMAIAAHDLRSPIASLISYIDLLNSSREWQPEPYRGTLREWHEILQDMLNLIGRMLHAHSAESQAGPQVVQSVAVAPLVQRSIARLQHWAQVKGIHLDLQADESFQIQTAPEPLEQALDNLISNAVKFSPLDSHIVISVARDAATCTIAVQDAGPGIHPDEAAQLFTKFHRGRNTPTGGEATSGMGLFIVYQLMASLGGTVAYEPAQPTGSIFRLQLPIGLGESEA